MPLQRRKTKGMPHSLFKSSVGGIESRQGASRCSPISGDSSAIPAGVTLVPNQTVLAAAEAISGPTAPGLISRLWLTVCTEESWRWRRSRFLHSVTWRTETGVRLHRFKKTTA